MKKTLLKRKYNPKAHFASEVDTSGNEKDWGCGKTPPNCQKRL